MFMPFAAGLLAGMLSGVLFAMGFCWHILTQSENGPGLFTPAVLIVPALYGSIFSLGYAFLAAACVAIFVPLTSWIIPLPKLIHTVTTCGILCFAFHLYDTPNPNYATMIEFGSYKGCCFLAAGLVTQSTCWNRYQARKVEKAAESSRQL